MISRFFFTTRISFTSSSSPFGQELPLMTRSQPTARGSLLQGRPVPFGSRTSMNVRLQLTGHQLHVVCSLVVLVYSSDSIASYPRKRVEAPGFFMSPAHNAAPIAPASPE